MERVKKMSNLKLVLKSIMNKKILLSMESILFKKLNLKEFLDKKSKNLIYSRNLLLVINHNKKFKIALNHYLRWSKMRLTRFFRKMT